MADRAESQLWYGDTGSGKTAQLGEAAKWEHARTGKITRLISADSGWDPLDSLVITPENPGGIIEAVNIQYLQNPFPVLIKLSEGYWPKLDSRLEPVMPSPGKYLMTPPKLDKIGQYAIEGLSTISSMLMQDHIRNLRKIAEDIVGDFTSRVDVEGSSGKVESVDLKFGKSGRAHYGHIQDFVLLDLVPRFATLPVARVIWTAHEAKGTDDISGIKDSVLGPATIGKAAVARTGMKFGDTFHFDTLTATKVNAQTRQTELSTEWRAYYEKHPDSVLSRMLWPAKLSLPLERIAELHRVFPGGFVPLTLDRGGMNRYLDFKCNAGGNGKV